MEIFSKGRRVKVKRSTKMMMLMMMMMMMMTIAFQLNLNQESDLKVFRSEVNINSLSHFSVY